MTDLQIEVEVHMVLTGDGWTTAAWASSTKPCKRYIPIYAGAGTADSASVIEPDRRDAVFSM